MLTPENPDLRVLVEADAAAQRAYAAKLGPALHAFEEAVVAAQRAYDEARAAPRLAYDAVAQQAYDEAMVAPRLAFNAVVRAAQRDYDAALKEAP